MGTTIFGISKTTIAGVLSALLAISGPASAFLAAIQQIQASQPGGAPANYTLAIIGASLTAVFAVLRIWLGLVQGDAPSTQPPLPAEHADALGKPEPKE